jgi:hypothetical protein
MTSHVPDQPAVPGQGLPDKPERSAEDVMWGRVNRKRERIRAEIHRNRAGGHKIPTWVLAAVLLLLLAGWAALVITS